MRAATSPISLAVLLVLPVAGLSCGFPSDWEFANGGSGGSGGTGGPGGYTTVGGGGSGGTTSTGGDTTSTGGSNMCAAGTADCDKDPDNGCETSLKTSTDCGACSNPCNLPNVVEPCSTGKCEMGTCVSPWDDCDGVVPNGCEANLLTDSANCGMCGKVCSGAAPSCANGACIAGCTPDGFEPNEAIQAPAGLPVLAGMRPFDQANNDFKTSESRTSSVMPTFTTDQDVDVFYLNVIDDAPLPMGAMDKASGFEITLSGIPSGATYSVDGYFICADGSQSVQVFAMDPSPCPIGGPNTGFVGGWWHCQQDAPAPLKSYLYGIGCDASGNADGVLQLQVKVVTPPASMTCSPYTLTVKVFQIAV